jgi:hypothetical protein
VRLTTLFRFRFVVTVALALAMFGCANAGTELTGPGGQRPSFDIAGDSSAVTAAGDSSGVAQDDSAGAEDGGTVAPAPDEGDSTVAPAPDENDGGIADAPDEGGDPTSSGYVVAY